MGVIRKLFGLFVFLRGYIPGLPGSNYSEIQSILFLIGYVQVFAQCFFVFFRHGHTGVVHRWEK